MAQEREFDLHDSLIEYAVRVALKELRETETWLKIIMKAQLIKPASKLKPLLQETDRMDLNILSEYRNGQEERQETMNLG